jgi:hypothetical protein
LALRYELPQQTGVVSDIAPPRIRSGEAASDEALGRGLRYVRIQRW